MEFDRLRAQGQHRGSLPFGAPLGHDQGHLQFLRGQRPQAVGVVARVHFAGRSQFRPGLPGPRLRAARFEVDQRARS
jgi:hypothetical protein